MSGTTQTSKGPQASRPAKPEEQRIIDDVLKLYQCKPSEQAYSHYAETAVFHDPVSIARGLESIKSQFNGYVLSLPTIRPPLPPLTRHPITRPCAHAPQSTD